MIDFIREKNRAASVTSFVILIFLLDRLFFILKRGNLVYQAILSFKMYKGACNCNRKWGTRSKTDIYEFGYFYCRHISRSILETAPLPPLVTVYLASWMERLMHLGRRTIGYTKVWVFIKWFCCENIFFIFSWFLFPKKFGCHLLFLRCIWLRYRKSHYHGYLMPQLLLSSWKQESDIINVVFVICFILVTEVVDYCLFVLASGCFVSYSY